nr:hypothetical protein Iba_chr02cCG6700 [Ipomoea batatas]
MPFRGHHLHDGLAAEGTVTRDRKPRRSKLKIVRNTLKAMSGLMLNSVRLNSCTATESMSPPTTSGSKPGDPTLCKFDPLLRTVDRYLLAQTPLKNQEYIYIPGRSGNQDDFGEEIRAEDGGDDAGHGRQGMADEYTRSDLKFLQDGE